MLCLLNFHQYAVVSHDLLDLVSNDIATFIKSSTWKGNSNVIVMFFLKCSLMDLLCVGTVSHIT